MGPREPEIPENLRMQFPRRRVRSFGSDARQNLNANPNTGPCVSTSYLNRVESAPDS